MAGRDVTAPCVDGLSLFSAVLAGRLHIEDLRANLECLDVRGPDRAKAADDVLVPRAILRQVERLCGSRRSSLGGSSGYEEDESGERESANRQHEKPRSVNAYGRPSRAPLLGE